MLKTEKEKLEMMDIHFLTSIITRAITQYIFDKVYLSSIPNHYSVSTLIQSLKKTGQKMLKIVSRNQALTEIDEQTDRQMDTKLHIFNIRYNIIPCSF